MSQEIITVVGISGVGKSTLLRDLASRINFQHLQASALIREARSAATKAAVTGDSLRLANIDENQRLLIDGFKVERDKAAGVVVLDGHTIIDTPSGLQEIGPEVFCEIGTTKFVFLADAPVKIAERRQGDSTRGRPSRTPTELREHQNTALLATLKAAMLMAIPIVVITPDQTTTLARLLTSRKPS